MIKAIYACAFAWSLKSGDALFGITVSLFFEIREIKENKVRLFFALNGPHKVFRIPSVMLDLGACLRPMGDIKRPASSVEYTTGISDHPTTCHGIKGATGR